MQILGYGEDALTLWALKNKLHVILQALGDPSPVGNALTFFRPSFGRRGGAGSPQFGEFDFILLTDACLYLGESKWAGASGEIEVDTIELRPEQVLRHQLFAFYVESWAFGDYASWEEFRKEARAELAKRGVDKPIPAEGSVLAGNLQRVLAEIRKRYSSLPRVRNVLLYLHKRTERTALPQKVTSGFELILLDYSDAGVGNFIEL